MIQVMKNALLPLTLLATTWLFLQPEIAAGQALQLDIVYRYSEAFHEKAAAHNYRNIGKFQKQDHDTHVQRLVKRDRRRHSLLVPISQLTSPPSSPSSSSQSTPAAPPTASVAAAPAAATNTSTVTASGNDTIIINSTVTGSPAGNSPFSVSLWPYNETAEVDSLGGLHYTFLSIGTPNLTFLVALDTGSDLLWVPCDCQQCSTTNWESYGIQNLDFSVYSPSKSNTSTTISCTDSICSKFSSSSSCGSDNKCDYVVNYMSSNTSTTGIVVQDILHLNYETSPTSGGLTTPIYFGCGEVQTGDLVEGVAPDGLFGLGPNSVSIPNTLASNGLVSNSFSMCFSSSDNSGRLVFGTQAKAGIRNTSLISSSVYYVVKLAKFTFGSQSYSTSQQVIFDTGTSYTTLPQSIVDELGTLVTNAVTFSTYQATDSFDYCWSISGSNDLKSFPNLTLTFSGGSTWEITNPYVDVYTNTNGDVSVVCLGVLKGSTSIIGYNFMPGYEFIFNQQTMTLSWAPSDCYTMNASTIGIRDASTTNKISETSSTSSLPRLPLETFIVILLLSFIVYL